MIWPFRKRPPPIRDRWDLSAPLFSINGRDTFTVGDACQGIQVFGSTGSGKSSAVVATIIRSYLSAGFGGLLLTTKPTDRDDYTRWCQETGRFDDLVIFSPTSDLRFNPIDAELRRQDAGAGLSENIVALLENITNIGERNQGQGGGQEDASYWKRTNRQLTRNSVELLTMATGKLSVPDLYRLVISAPTSRDQLRSEEWKNSSFCFQCLVEAERKPKSPQQQTDFELVADFFLIEFANLSDKTRSVVVSTFTSTLDVLNRGTIRELLGTTTNIRPEAALDGKLILIDLPIKVFGEVGMAVQILWKYCFQLAMERRDIRENSRPVFILSDESHLVAVAGSDQKFQSTARSSRTATVYSTQSISNYLTALGDKGDAAVYSLLGNLQCQVFTQQTDVKTNTYASELIGRTRQYLMNANNSYQTPNFFELFPDTQGQLSTGVSETYEYEVQPSVFATLRKGGPPHFQVDGIMYQGGRQFSQTGGPWTPVTFSQQF